MVRRIMVLGLMVIASLSISACAGQKATPAPAKAFGSLTISIPTKTLAHAAQYVAEAKGFFQEQGFSSVEIIPAGGGTPSQNAVQGGQADFGGGNAFAGIVDATAAGKPELTIFVNAKQQTEDLIIRKDMADRLGITSNSSFDQKMKVLKGLTFAVTSRGAGTDELTRYVLIAAGYDPEKDANIVPMGAMENMIAGMASKEIDVAALTIPFNEWLISKGEGVRLVGATQGEFEPIRDFLYLVTFGMKDFIDKNPELTQAYVTALVKAAKFIRENSNEAKQIMRSQHFPDIDERAFEASWDLIYRYSATPEVTAEGAEKSFRLKKVVWGQEANFPAEQVIDNKFVQKAKEQLGWR